MYIISFLVSISSALHFLLVAIDSLFRVVLFAVAAVIGVSMIVANADNGDNCLAAVLTPRWKLLRQQPDGGCGYTDGS